MRSNDWSHRNTVEQLDLMQGERSIDVSPGNTRSVDQEVAVAAVQEERE